MDPGITELVDTEYGAEWGGVVHLYKLEQLVLAIKILCAALSPKDLQCLLGASVFQCHVCQPVISVQDENWLAVTLLNTF